MNKAFKFYVLILLSVFALPVLSNDKGAERMKIGYTQGDLAVSLGTDVQVITKGAIQFPASYMSRLKGNRIMKVRIGIGNSLTEQQNSIFITNKLDGKPAYTQVVSQLDPGWNEIVLDTPFEINGEELFIGYQYTTRGMTVSFDGGETSDYANWIAFAESEDELSWGHQNKSGCLNIEAIIEGSGLPQNDAAVYAVESRKYAQTGGEYPIELLVRNMAAADINSIEVAYDIEGQDPVVKTVDGLCIQSNEIALVCVDHAIIQEAGIYDLSVRITKVNGVDDENEPDNQGAVGNIISKPEYTRRKVLLEQFSTAKCNNCPAAHKLIAKHLRYEKDNVIWLVHHSGFYTDDLTIDESKSYTYFYGTASTYAPAAMLDRTNMAQFGALDGNYNTTPAPVFNTSSDMKKLIDDRLNSAALISVHLDSKYESDSRQLSVSVYGEVLSGSVERLKGDDIRLNIYLVEDSIPGVQSGIEGKYINNHAIRKVLTGVWGDEFAFVDGKYHSKEYTFTIPGEWKEKCMRIIAFVANSDPKNPNNAQVYNAEEVELVSGGVSSIDYEKENAAITIYPVSESLFINGAYTSAVIYNITGHVVQTVSQPESKLSIATLERGVYIIRFEANGRSVVCKFLKY